MSKCLHTSVSLTSLFFAIALLITSSLVLYQNVKQRSSLEVTKSQELITQVNAYFGGSAEHVYDLDLIFRILISVSAMSLIAAFFQLIFAVFLLFSTITTTKLSESERRIARMWVFAQTLIMLALLGGEICIACNDLEVKDEVWAFLAVAGIDIMFLIITSPIVCIFSFRKYYKDI